jgi:hypothetical protein
MAESEWQEAFNERELSKMKSIGDRVSAFEIKTSHYILGAVALTAALSWNSAIREAINKSFPIPKDEIFAGFIYAVIITVMLIVLIEYLPSTTSELPSGVKEKIRDAEFKENLANRITRLELGYRPLQTWVLPIQGHTSP